MKTLSYRPEIDGLRALAVVPVILFHLKPYWIKGGFLGVDVFLVISGFLITSIILKEYESGVFDFKQFWLRRVRRILPVLTAVVLASILAAHFLIFKTEQADIGIQGFSALYSFANFSMWRMTGDYWGSEAGNSPFLHTWSLSVEEQFYLLFPVGLFLLLKFRPGWIVSCLTGLVLISFPMFLIGMMFYPGATFFLLPTRAWELGTGALLAVLLLRNPQLARHRMGRFFGMAGVATITLSYFVVTEAVPFPATFLMPVIGTVLVLAFAGQGLVCRFLSLAPMVFTGRISYSLYMWHWPLIVFLRQAGISSPKIGLALTLVIALASYYLIEKPARSGRGTLLPLLICFIAATLGTLWLSAIPNAYDTSNYSPSVWKGMAYASNPTLKKPNGRGRLQSVEVLGREKASENAFRDGGIFKNYSNNPSPQILVLGDSHALMWAGTIDEIAKELRLNVLFYALNGVYPFMGDVKSHAVATGGLSPEEKDFYDRKRIEIIEKEKPSIVILIAHWARYSEEDLRPTLLLLEKEAGHIILIEQPPELKMGDINLTQYLCSLAVVPKRDVKYYLPVVNDPSWEKGRDMLRAVFAEFPKVKLLSVNDLYEGPDHQALVLEGNNVLYIDDDHLNEYGAMKARRRLEELIVSLLKADGVDLKR